jgi:hypothetical protein
MAFSRAATIGVFVTLGMAIYGFAPGIAFLVGGVAVTGIYRILLRRCFNFFNPMALTGAGMVVLVYSYTGIWTYSLLAGLVVSIIVGFLHP